MDLEKFGIMEGISEVIVTTISESGEFNAAPIGIIKEQEIIYAKIFPNTHTYNNIKSVGVLVANVTKDPELFVISALSDLGRNYYEKFHGYPAIRNAEAWILFNCKILQNQDQYQNQDQVFSLIYLEALSGRVNFSTLTAVSRAQNAVIEATVHASRYVINRDRKLKEWIDYYDIVVSKCGGAREKRAMKRLYEFLGSRSICDC